MNEATSPTRSFAPGKRAAGFVCIVLNFAVCMLFPPATRADQPIAITHVTVIDGTGAKPKSDQTVLVAGDRIAAVGGVHRVKVPVGAKIIDATGKFLIPGLWDMHVHGTGETPHFSELNIANGVIGVRDMFGMMTNIMAERRAIAAGKPGPRIVAAGRIIDGAHPVWPDSVPVKDAEEGRRAVRLVKGEGSDFIKVYQLLSREAYFAIATEARREGLVFAGHVPDAISAAEASDAGQKSMEHLIGVLRGCSTQEVELMSEPQAALETELGAAMINKVLETYNEQQAQSLFARFKRNHTWQCPTLTVINNIAHLYDGSLTNDIRLRYIDSETRNFWNPTNDFRFANMSRDVRIAMQKACDKRQEIVGKMRRAGVEILAGTDTPNPYCFPGFTLHDELARLVDAGLTPMEALQSATINAARYLDRENELGSIHAHKFADLVLLDANPLADIHNTTKIRAVFANGRYYDRVTLDRFLRDAEVDAQIVTKRE